MMDSQNIIDGQQEQNYGTAWTKLTDSQNKTKLMVSQNEIDGQPEQSQ